MAEAGIDTTIYTRSASSTKAVQLGFSIKDVKDHVNWSQQSQIFEKYYYKPNQKDKVSTAIENSMLNSITDNNTISGVRTKAASIGVCTSCNTNVAVVRTKDMVTTNPSTSFPWYRRTFEFV